MKLARYLRINDIPRKVFASRLGVHVHTINKMCAPRRRRCSVELAQRIVEATSGAVTLEDLLLLDSGEGHRGGASKRDENTTNA